MKSIRLSVLRGEYTLLFSDDAGVVTDPVSFDTSFRPSFPILFDGKNLQDQLQGDMVGYLGLSYRALLKFPTNDRGRD